MVYLFVDLHTENMTEMNNFDTNAIQRACTIAMVSETRWNIRQIHWSWTFEWYKPFRYRLGSSQESTQPAHITILLLNFSFGEQTNTKKHFQDQTNPMTDPKPCLSMRKQQMLRIGEKTTNIWRSDVGLVKFVEFFLLPKCTMKSHRWMPQQNRKSLPL